MKQGKKQREILTLCCLILPVAAILVVASLAAAGAFKTRPAFRVIKNQVSFTSVGGQRITGKALHEVVIEFRTTNGLDALLHHEKKVDSQRSAFDCVDSKTGTALLMMGGGMEGKWPRFRNYALYRRQDLQRARGDLKFIMTMGFLEGGHQQQATINKTVPRSFFHSQS